MGKFYCKEYNKLSRTWLAVTVDESVSNDGRKMKVMILPPAIMVESWLGGGGGGYGHLSAAVPRRFINGVTVSHARLNIKRLDS
jgi:hypothetical protein